MDLQSIPLGLTMLAADVGLLRPSSAARCRTLPLDMSDKKKSDLKSFLTWTRSALDHRHHPHMPGQIQCSMLLLVSSVPYISQMR